MQLIFRLQVGWYNEKVVKRFQLPFSEDTLAVVVISTPAMFDHVFKPFILRQECVGNGPRDMLDMCVAEQFSLVQQVYYSLVLVLLVIGITA